MHFERTLLIRMLQEREQQPLNKGYSHEDLELAVECFRPDLLVSAGFDKIVRRNVLQRIPRSINVHFGRLPRYRGSWSIPWAILNNESYIGVTVHRIDLGIDSGEILFQETFRNDPLMSCKSLYVNAVDVGVRLVREYIAAVNSDAKEPQGASQLEEEATYYPPEFPYGYRIPWKQTVRFVYNYIRACFFPPYSPAYTVMGIERVGIAFPVRLLHQKEAPAYGTIVEIGGEYWVAVLNGYIAPQTISVNGQNLAFSEYVKTRNMVGRRFEA